MRFHLFVEAVDDSASALPPPVVSATQHARPSNSIPSTLISPKQLGGTPSRASPATPQAVSPLSAKLAKKRHRKGKPVFDLPQLPPLKVLVVEDDEVNRSALLYRTIADLIRLSRVIAGMLTRFGLKKDKDFFLAADGKSVRLSSVLLILRSEAVRIVHVQLGLTGFFPLGVHQSG